MNKKHFLYAFVLLGYILRFLTAHLLGALFLAGLAYIIWPHLVGITPYSPAQLLDWFMKQPDSTKTLLATSILTIVGFLIAFQSGSSATRKQMQAQIRLDAATQIHFIYTEILRQVIQMRIHADFELDLLENIRLKKDERELNFELRFLLSKNQEFLEARSKFGILQNQAFDIYGRYFSVLFATRNTFELLQRINASLALVADKMWIVPSNQDPDSPIWKDLYVRFTNENDLRAFSDQCTKTHQYVSGMSGAVKGIISAPIIEQNIWTFFNLTRKGLGLLELMDSISKGQDVSGDKIDSVFPPQAPPK